MRKIIILFCFVSGFCWSQKKIETFTTKEKVENTKYVSLDSLQVIFEFNNKILQGSRVSVKTASKIIYPFLKVLKNQKKIHSQRNNKDKEGINLIQIETIFDLIRYVHAQNRSIDSTFYYHEKITELTNDPEILADSYGRLGNAYSLNNMKVKAIDYYEKGLNIKRKFKNKHKLIYPLVNITNCLIELESYEHAKHHIIELTQAIESNPESNIYESRKKLVKIMQAKLLTAKKKYKEALQILNKIDSTKIKRETIKRRYFSILSETYKGINNFSLGEFYLDKAYRFTRNNIDISNVKYYIEKLSYALHADSLKKADIYFKKINKIKLLPD